MMKKSSRKVISLLCLIAIVQNLFFGSNFFLNAESLTTDETVAGLESQTAAETVQENTDASTGNSSEETSGSSVELSVPEFTDVIISTTSVSLTWEPVSNSTAYDLEADGSIIQDIADTSYTHTGLTPNTSHTYRVRAKNETAASEWSTEKNVTTAALSTAQVKLQMVNANRAESINSIYPHFKLFNTGDTPLDLSETKIKYYYTVEGIESQKFWCDWSSIGGENVTGSFTRLSNPKEGADYCLEIGFGEGAGSIQPGESAEMQIRFANTEWSVYTQTNDYSFNSIDTDYKDWNKATVYYSDTLIWGEEPSIDVPALEEQDAKLQMYNGNRTDVINTVYPWYKLFNTGSKPIDLENVRIRYYFTEDGDISQKFWCDWSTIGSGNVTGKFIEMSAPIDSADYCFEMSFTAAAGQLLPGGGLEIQSRFAKSDWSNYSQTNDYSFNSSSSSYVDWDKVAVYIGDDLVWGEEIMLEIPGNITVSTTETDTTLTWDSVEGAVEYDVEADGTIINAGASTTYSMGGLNPGTLHKYRVRARSNLTEGLWSDIIEKWTLPAIPGNLATSSGKNSIVVTWGEVTGAAGYDIEVQGTAIDNGSQTTYTHTGLNPNLQQTYRVRAKNASGTGKWSAIVAGTTLPGIPSNLKAAASEESILLKWDNMAGATEYDVEADGSITSGITESSFTHSGLLPNTEHSYRVRAKNVSGTGEWSEQIKATTLLPVPENIAIAVSSAAIALAWEKVDIATGYDVEANGSVINNGNKTEYKTEGLEAGSKHVFRIRAANGSNTSAWSSELTVITLPDIPGNVAATATNNEITVSWDIATGADSYEIEVDGNVVDNGLKTTYIHSGLAAGAGHTYRVRAGNSTGAGEWSGMISVSTDISAPEGLEATATSYTVSLSWSAVQGAKGYDLLVDGTITDAGNETAYVHKELEPNSVHVYRVRTRKTDGFSAWSAAVVQSTMVGVPSVFSASATSEAITLSWNKVEDATKYEIEADGVLTDVGDKNSFTHSGLVTCTKHTYRVRAGNDNGMGDWTDTLTKITAPPAPENLKAVASINEINLSWDASTGATGYEVEVNGVVEKDISDTKFVHSNLEPNTRQAYRVRATYEDGTSEWSDLLEANTLPELVIKVPKDNKFNFVVAAPAKKDAETRIIKVTYDPDELEVVDLYANTPGIELQAGAIEDTDVSVTAFTPGEIVYEVKSANKTVVNIIRFLSKTNDNAKVSYTIE